MERDKAALCVYKHRAETPCYGQQPLVADDHGALCVLAETARLVALPELSVSSSCILLILDISDHL